MIGVPFCDYFKATAPLDRQDELTADLVPIIETAGGVAASPNLYRFADCGTVQLHPSRRVFCIGASGAALARLRACQLFTDFLAAVGAGAHRVTEIDVAYDLPLDAAPIVWDVYARAMAGQIALTRKRISKLKVTCTRRMSLYEPHHETGTVYLNSGDAAEVSAKVYDKRNERIDAGHEDPGPMVRFEPRIRSGLGITLRDAYDPAGVFWHVAAPGLLAAPAGTPAWVGHGTGFELERRRDVTPYQRMRGLIEASTDLERALVLADQCGPGGRDALLGLLRRRVKGRGSEASAAAEDRATAADRATAVQ